jgi:hypothetical protein
MGVDACRRDDGRAEVEAEAGDEPTSDSHFSRHSCWSASAAALVASHSLNLMVQGIRSGQLRRWLDVFFFAMPSHRSSGELAQRHSSPGAVTGAASYW